MILEIREFSVKYGAKWALQDVSLQLPMAAVGLLGPNGAGKSTLIKTVLGLIPPHTGSGRFLNFRLGQADKKVRQYVGYMPESDCLIPGFTAVQYVSYCAQLNGMDSRTAFKRAHKVLYLVGLEEARYRKLETYSTGMKQRLKLAQAIVHDPHILFLDEPTNGLDPDGREEMLALIREIAQIEGRCIVLASHLMRDVERCTDYLVILHQGRVKVQGMIKDLCKGQANRYAIRVNGDQQQAMNLLKARGIPVHHPHRREPSFEVDLHENVLPRDLFDLLIRHGIQIRKLTPRHYTVAEVYKHHVALQEDQPHGQQQ